MSVQSIHAFAEKVALVTDGDNPIGRAVALQLALQGSYVIVGFSHISEANRRALAELANLGTLASAVGQSLNPATDLAITARWGVAGQGGVTMPSTGTLVERSYTVEERATIASGTELLGMSVEQANDSRI